MTNLQNQSLPLSKTEAAVLQIAQREASPQFAGEFEPITRGFIFAVISLGALGVMAGACILWRILVRTLSRNGAAGR